MYQFSAIIAGLYNWSYRRAETNIFVFVSVLVLSAIVILNFFGGWFLLLFVPVFWICLFACMKVGSNSFGNKVKGQAANRKIIEANERAKQAKRSLQK